MPTYTYETRPPDPETPRRRFELRQSINDSALSTDPETGEPVERVITGGQVPLTALTGGVEPTITGGCGPRCGCA
ncbi:MAG: zinc ribbon domain-containing protein [Gemmatimonadales bacterium]